MNANMIDRNQDGFSVEICEMSQGFLQKSYLESSDLGDAIYYALVAVRSQPIEVLAEAVANCNYPELLGYEGGWLEVLKAEQAFIDAAGELQSTFSAYRHKLRSKHKGDICNANE